MKKSKLHHTIYSYLLLYKNGITLQDVLKNIEIFKTLCNEIPRNNCDLNLQFVSGSTELFDIRSTTKSDFYQFQIDLMDVDYNVLSQLLFGEINCSDFLFQHSQLVDTTNDYEMDFRKRIYEANTSWDKFVERIGFNEDSFIKSDEADVARQEIKNQHILWCYNKSCTGKTFLGLYTLMYANKLKIVYNPTTHNSCDANILSLIVQYGINFAVLIDDLQCDIEFAKRLFDYLCNHKEDVKRRNLHVFLVSWSSLRQKADFAMYAEMIPTIETRPQRFINMMTSRISDPVLLNICDDNLALISMAYRLNRETSKHHGIKESTRQLFGCFVQTSNIEQLRLIHVLAVLGTYEFETPAQFIENFGLLRLENVVTAKIVGDSIFLAHRTVSNFIARYIENEYTHAKLYERKEIIKRYINYIDNRKKWKVLVHLMGENNKSDILSVSPLWNLMYEFQKNLKNQTNLDPSWNNTPSSMYFVISTASMLGVVDEYIDVIKALCSNFTLNNSNVAVNFSALQTTFDFIKIQEHMIDEDRCTSHFDYESGEDIDLVVMHRNWLYGLMVGLKTVLLEVGHQGLILQIEEELINAQCTGGYWYPKRVPWVTARILIGLSEAGHSVKEPFIQNGVNYLLGCLQDGKWDAHTGGWNNTFETTSLCLEALIKCGVDCERYVPQDVIKNLQNTSSIWMSENYEIDGTTTACVLLKILGIQNDLLYYVNELVSRNIHNIVDIAKEVDYNTMQSCKITQIAYYAIELCWYILEKDMPSLLDDFVIRAEQAPEGSKMENHQIFISYSEDSPSHIKKIARIAEYLEQEGFTVYFYHNAPLGTNNMEFMQKINQCDATIVIGTKLYKQKSSELKSGGAFFEACVLSREFMNHHYEKIIPVAFDDFGESFPEPFAINKGMRVRRIDKKFLEALAFNLKAKFKK